MAAKFGTISAVALLTVLAAGCGSSPPPEPQPAPSSLFAPDADVVGCYDVVRLKWEPLTLPSRLQGPASEPPQLFFLSSDLLLGGERKIKSKAAAHPSAAWHIKEQQVSWAPPPHSSSTGMIPAPQVVRILELSWRAEVTVIASVQQHPTDARAWEGRVTRFSGSERAEGWMTLRRTSAAYCSFP